MFCSKTYRKQFDRKIILRSFWFLILKFFFLFSLTTIAQTKASSKKPITAEFLFDEVEFKEISVMTNVLKVKNNNGKTYTFTISTNIPNGWKSLVNADKEYVLKPNDSAYVPVRIVTTNKKAKGGTKYSIAAYVNTNEGRQMAYARFMAGRPKVTNWQMQVLPRPRIYFLNGENTAQFQLNVSNEGDEDQEVIVSMQKIGTDIVVKDSSNLILKKNYLELKLAPYTDTTLGFNIQVLEKLRNQRRVDNWNFSPISVARERRYGLFIRASEVRLEKNGAGQKNKKVDFVKLANSIDFVKLNNSTIAGNGSNTIPLSVFLNFNNLLGQQPIANVFFQGNSQVGRLGGLNYQFQTGFLFYRYTNEFFKNRLTGNITYNFGKGYVGAIFSGGPQGQPSTKGIIGGYQFGKHHFIGANLFRDRFFSKASINNYGFLYGANYNKVKFNLNSNFFQNANFSGTGYNINSNVNFLLIKRTNLSLFYLIQNAPISSNNSLLNTTYGLSFNSQINRYCVNFNGNYSENRNVTSGSNSLSNVLFFTSLFQSFSFKKGYGVSLINSYSSNSPNGILPNSTANNFSFINTFAFNPKAKKRPVNFSPAIYTNYQRFLLDTMLSGGIQVNAAYSDFENNFFIGGFFRGGYNKLISYIDYGSIFNAQFNVFARYKVWNIIALYNYGPISNIELAYYIRTIDGNYPQTIRLSAGHQYQFKNLHFIWENNPTYLYLTTLKRHGFSMFSQLFYFTNNNYRFGLNVTYNFTSGFSYKYDYSNGANSSVQLKESDERVTSKNFIFGFNLKKDFSIPIPKRFRNKRFCDATFFVFLDVNGNGKMDDSEIPVENVVLRMNDYEVITDEKGKGSFINMAFDKYHVQVFPLIDMGSWFPNIDDSLEVCGPDPMYLPFSKGVQVYGNVELDHEAYAGELFDKLDISRFKIYLIDSAGKTYSSITDNRGNFNFYVPHSKYTLKFDEKALGNEFYLPENDIPLDLGMGIESYFHHFLILQKKRKVRKKVFGPDGKVTYVEEDAASVKDKNGKDKKDVGNEKDKQAKNDKSSKDGKPKNEPQNEDDNDETTVKAKESQLDSLIDLLNQLIAKAATKADVRAIVKMEMQNLVNDLNTTFTIQVDELPKGKSPNGLLLQMVRMKKVEELKIKNGNTIYYSGDFKNVNDAEKFCRDYQTSGFKKAKVLKRGNLLKLAK